jgi:hypothetical protein
MRKSGSASRAAKRGGSHKTRRGAPHRTASVKAKTARRGRKAARRVTVFKSTSWYQIAAQSIGISPRAAP